MNWTKDEQKIQVVLDTLADGFSFSIAGDKIGVSRSAVAGFVWRRRRRGLPVPRVQKWEDVEKMGKPKVKKVKAKAKEAGPPKQLVNTGVRKAPTKVELPTGYGLRTTLTVRRFGECKFPMAGLGADMTLCGEPTVGDHTPYCVRCAAIAYKIEPRRRVPGQRFNLPGWKAAR